MNKLLQYQLQVNATLGTTFKQLHRKLLSWNEFRAVPKFDGCTQYDIGEDDCRPQPAKPAKDYSTSFEAMLNRSI